LGPALKRFTPASRQAFASPDPAKKIQPGIAAWRMNTVIFPVDSSAIKRYVLATY